MKGFPFVQEVATAVRKRASLLALATYPQNREASLCRQGAQQCRSTEGAAVLGASSQKVQSSWEVPAGAIPSSGRWRKGVPQHVQSWRAENLQDST